MNDNQCQLLTASMVCDIKDYDFPKEWQYDENDRPTCTKWKKWEWTKDDDGNFIEPIEPEPEDPNQLKISFE